MKKTIIGSGQYNLDTIVLQDYAKGQYKIPFRKRLALQEVGGTCGNVMCILAWMGWDARPLACLDDSPEGMKVAADLQRYGCDCRHVTNRPDGGTTLLQCTHHRYADGTHRMSVRAGAPGGSRFPKRRYLRARDEAPAFLPQPASAPAERLWPAWAGPHGEDAGLPAPDVPETAEAPAVPPAASAAALA